VENLSSFCTCAHSDCPLHPTKHDKGCAPCIAKNLKMGEIPDCFFNKLGAAESRSGVKFADFAKAVMENENFK